MNGMQSFSLAIKPTLLLCTNDVHFIEIPLRLLKRHVEFNQRYWYSSLISFLGGRGGGGMGVLENEQGRTRVEGGGNLERTYFLNVPKNFFVIDLHRKILTIVERDIRRLYVIVDLIPGFVF